MSERNSEELESHITSLIKDDSLKDLTKEYFEIGIDSFLKDGGLKDLPFIGTGLAIIKIGNNISNYFFAKKLLICLNEISTIKSNRRKLFIEEMVKKKLEQKVGETLVFMISRADSVAKSKLIGKLYKNCILGTISYDELQRLCYLVDKAYLGDLEQLRIYSKNGQIPSLPMENLLNIGAIKISGIGGQTTHGHTQGFPLYRISEIGTLFVNTIEGAEDI